MAENVPSRGPHDARHPVPGSNDRAAIAACMARIVAGDDAAKVTLAVEFGHRVRFVVRSILLDMGRRDVIDDVDELDGLVMEACLTIADRASGWSPDGALPWTWAHAAIRATVARVIGHRLADVDTSTLAEAPMGPVVAGDQAYGSFLQLAARDPYVAMLLEALRRVANPRDYEVTLDYVFQKSNGDPSPSHTVAHMHRLMPDNVRQIFSRTRRRLLEAIDADPALEPLLGVWWLHG